MFEDAANRADVQAETTVAGKHLPYFGFTPERGVLTQVKDAFVAWSTAADVSFAGGDCALEVLANLLALPFQPTVAGGPRPVDGVQAQGR